MPPADRPRPSSRVRWWSGLTVLSAALVAADYRTGPVVQFPLTFVLPVFPAARHLGRRPGVAFAAALTGARFLVTLAWDAPGLAPAHAAVNSAIRLTVLAGVAVAVARLADQNRRIRELEGLISVCSFCRKVRQPDGTWESLEALVARQTPARFSHGLCGPCGREHYPEVFGPPEAELAAG